LYRIKLKNTDFFCADVRFWNSRGDSGRWRGQPLLTLAVDLAPIAKAQDGNQDLLVLNLANHTPITDPVSPEFAQLAAVESFADGARIVQGRDPLAQEGADTLRASAIQFA
jgi:hypothetical protein